MKKLLFIPMAFLFFAACELAKIEITTEQIVDGLKTALKVGAEESVTSLSATDGFYGNALLRIPLPPEADVIKRSIDNELFRSLGIDKILNTQLEGVVKRINKAAETAAPEAKTIFIDAIVGMSITDGTAILNGTYGNPTSGFDSISATKYLKEQTYEKLTKLFSPFMKAALDKPIVGSISTTEAWNELTATYNKGAVLIGQPKVEKNIEVFTTQKALDGLFYQIGLIEKDIRRNPAAWAAKTAQSILDLVFGSVAAG
ncbi:MAG TPA: hypothetical protein DCQ31_02395 [Bacteroidales bacterium]|nr:hypothetical protein [Bacteroidales bacterium]